MSGRVRISNSQIDEMSNLMRALTANQICGICEDNKNATGENSPFYFTLDSEVAHIACFEKVKAAELDLMKKIATAYLEDRERNMAHARAVRAVRKAENSTIIKIIESKGAGELQRLFNSVGEAAAIPKKRRKNFCVLV